MMIRSVRARHDESTRLLPGDDILEPATESLTHAITIHRPRRDVWPWLAQMGAGRAGWYSYDFIDNGGRRSAEWIIPELQQVATGDIFPALPGVTMGFTLLRYDPERYLILGWYPAPDEPPMMTWAFVLEEPTPDTTRLVVRSRVSRNYQPPFGLPTWTVTSLVPWGHFIMQRKQLHGIARRAEGRRRTQIDDLIPGGVVAAILLASGALVVRRKLLGARKRAERLARSGGSGIMHIRARSFPQPHLR